MRRSRRWMPCATSRISSRSSLIARDDYDWRLGRDRYTRKFRYTLASGADPADVLETADAQPAGVRARMLELALPLHRSYFPGPQGPRGSGRSGARKTW